MTASELLRLGAEFLLGIEPLDMTPKQLETPLYTGRLLALQVQPGLMLNASDVVYISEQSFSVEMEPALVCGVMLTGSTTRTVVEDYGAFVRYPRQINLMGFDRPVRYTTPLQHGKNFRSAGFILQPSFFERFGADIDDDGLEALRDLTSGGFQTATIAHSARINAIAASCLSHPYGGHLGKLFLESAALAYVVEAAHALKEERRLVAIIGRREYDRVMHAREILDSDLADTPTTLELARRVGTNVTTLQANFKAVFGRTIFAHVREQRLSMARILLEEHGLPVTEAARRVGFARATAFSTAYRKHFGHSPKEDLRKSAATRFS